jgi:hypothetical protein
MIGREALVGSGSAVAPFGLPEKETRRMRILRVHCRDHGYSLVDVEPGFGIQNPKLFPRFGFVDAGHMAPRRDAGPLLSCARPAGHFLDLSAGNKEPRQCSAWACSLEVQPDARSVPPPRRPDLSPRRLVVPVPPRSGNGRRVPRSVPICRIRARPRRPPVRAATRGRQDPTGPASIANRLRRPANGIPPTDSDRDPRTRCPLDASLTDVAERQPLVAHRPVRCPLHRSPR